MQNPFSWDYLTAPVYETPVWGPFSIAYLVVFGLGFLAALALYNGMGNRLTENPVIRAESRRVGAFALAIFATGLFFFLFRFLRVSAWGLHMRIWLYLTAVAALALVGYYLYYWQKIYPVRMRAIEAKERKRRYMTPAVTGGSGRGRRRAKSRKKRRR